jgi:hypothetical protein
MKKTAFYVGCQFGTYEGGFDWTAQTEKFFETPFASLFMVMLMLMNDLGDEYVYFHQSYYSTFILVRVFLYENFKTLIV